MNSPANCEVVDIRRKTRFMALVPQVFSLDPAIEWVALEEAGRKPRWAWRDSETGSLCAGTATGSAELVDPLLLTLAEGRDDLQFDEEGANPHHLLFVVLAYANLVVIVVRLGPDAHISVAIAPGTDVCGVGLKLVGFLDCSKQPSHMVTIDGNVPA